MTARSLTIIAHAETREGRRSIELHGRDAWTLSELVQAGHRGVSSRTYPGVRLAAHIFNLRQMGAFDISTPYETHPGPLCGVHGRYVLENNVTVEWPDDEGEAA